ncbi:MAG: hypothetical protein HY290_25140, partial [Planctomycetia bacterium]|nr:hypothetical protein [Planctomycetia bacterium]
PGIGKTLFLKRFLASPELESLPAHTTLIDLRPFPYDARRPDDFLAFVKQQLVEVAILHLARLGDPCHDVQQLPDLTTDDAQRRYHKIALKIHSLPPLTQNPTREQIHYLYIDDVDYVDDTCFTTMLEYLRPFLLSRYFCVIVACRIPAYNTIRSHRDYNITNAFEDARTLHLAPLSVYHILTRRIEMLTEESRSLRRLVSGTGLLPSVRALYEKCVHLVKQLPESDDIEVFEYPFTGKQHHYMQEMSNGNIRLVLLMATTYLRYMAANRNAIHSDVTGGYWVGRKAVIQLFSSAATDEQIRIHDLHQDRTYLGVSKAERRRRNVPWNHVGNSILVIAIETVRRYQSPLNITEKVICDVQDNYGVSRAAFADALATLLRLGLIRTRELHGRAAMGDEAPPRAFDLTKRGEYYSDYLIHWDEYIAKFGFSRHNEDVGSYHAREGLRSALLELCLNLMLGAAAYFCSSAKSGRCDFKMSKEVFGSRFRTMYRDVIAQLDETDKHRVPVISANRIEVFLTVVLNVVEQHGIDDTRTYLFRADRIVRAAQQAGWPIEKRYIYDEDEFATFVAVHVKLPEYEYADEGR